MQYCNHCKVHIKNKTDRCALCGNILPPLDDGTKIKRTFPVIPPFYQSHLAMKIMIFISIASVVVSFAINMIFPSDINWPILFVFALISVWLGLIVILQKRYHIPKKIIWQVAIISLLSIFWDWKTGWRGWSLDYVIPAAIVSAMILMYVTARIMKLSARDYITYSLIDGFLGIIPILFILFDWVNVIYPSIISITVSIVSLLAIFVFQGQDIRAELDKRMHI